MSKRKGEARVDFVLSFQSLAGSGTIVLLHVGEVIIVGIVVEVVENFISGVF